MKRIFPNICADNKKWYLNHHLNDLFLKVKEGQNDDGIYETFAEGFVI